MKYGVIIPITTVLSACAQTQPIVVPEVIHTKTYIPVPVSLTAPISAVLPLGTTYGQGLGILNAAVQTCNANLSAIATLKPPPGR